MENSAPTKRIIPFALVGYEVIITNSRYALVDYFITSYPTRAHGIIVIYPNQKALSPLSRMQEAEKLAVRD